MNDTYTPPKVWKWEGQDGGAFTNITSGRGCDAREGTAVGEHRAALLLGRPTASR